MATTKRSVCVWLDETSEGRDNAMWIVSIGDGEGEDTTVSTHPSRMDALEAGAALASVRGLPLVDQSR